MPATTPTEVLIRPARLQIFGGSRITRLRRTPGQLAAATLVGELRALRQLEGDQRCQRVRLTEVRQDRLVATPRCPDVREQRVEAHLLDFDRDIYGMHVSVNFLHKLRGEEKFASLDLLKTQIGRDVVAARDYFDAHPLDNNFHG